MATTKSYRISNRQSGQCMGIWSGDSELAAIDAMHVDAGYPGGWQQVEEMGLGTTEELLVVDVATIAREVSDIVGHDGSGDIRVIVDQALAENPESSVSEIAGIVRDARADWAAERERERE